MSIPDDFPRYGVPGHEKEMESLRALYWLHYPGSGPKATLWDGWLSAPGLWPAVQTDNYAEYMRVEWSRELSNRIIDKDGYVSVHQHASIAHPYGWPFPFWNAGVGGYGWHFSFEGTVGHPWRQSNLNTTDGWKVAGASDEGIHEQGWELKLTAPSASVTTPQQPIDAYNAPFIQMRWKASGLGKAQPYLEWTTKDKPRFGPDRRFYFDAVESASIVYTVIPVYKHSEWKDQITQIRVNFGNTAPGAAVTVQAFFTQYDTRHDITSQLYVQGCDTYFRWTRDLGFLRRNVNRMRTALRYVMSEHQALKRQYVFNTWFGHDGRSGLKVGPDGKKEILYGHGIGDNYWDLLPFGWKDAYASMLYYDALRRMASIERDIREHPEWDIPIGTLAFEPDMLLRHAADVKAAGNKLFWNPMTGRFVPNIDQDGRIHDYGFTFLNLEAVYYDFASLEHAKRILSWISGKRTLRGDTAQGSDIYHWRFAPRATTKRNIDYYYWGWSGPETIPFGAQVQDGGAVLGFAYHDLMARLKVLGPDDAWARLQETIKWFDEVQAAGGYRAYYNGSREGALQGSGTAGGLGLDQEFFESVLVPQVMIDGFLGFRAFSDGFALNPRLPSAWPELTIDRIHLHNLTLRVRATGKTIEVFAEGGSDDPCIVRLPEGKWKATLLDKSGAGVGKSLVQRSDGTFRLEWSVAPGVRFKRGE
ncbi:MAG: glycosyl hydrolase family 65 protein [Armatimonadota bacterium]|nr:glycosyl hydrolase family 65 protein [Armatimonadota bacterium]